MLFYLLPLLASLSYNLPVSCLSDPDIDSLNLLPVHVRDWEHVLGKRHRKKVDFADIAPKDYARLIWGKDGVHANMLLHAQSGRDIVLLEAFEGLTQSIDCKGDDGSMSLTFKSKAAFEYALQHWSFINDDEEKDFLLIANHDGCGPDDQRQPYLITKVHEDKSKLTTHLTSQIAKWQDVTGPFELDFGKVLQHPRPPGRMSKRFDFLESAENLFGKYPYGESVAFDVALGDEKEPENVFRLENDIFIRCINCYWRGSYEVEGHLKWNGFAIDDFTFDTTSKDTRTAIEIEAKLLATDSFISKNIHKNLFKQDIPKAKMEIAGILKITLLAAYDIGVSFSLIGEAIIRAGLEVKVPDRAVIHSSVKGKEPSSAVGFNSGPVTPFFNIKSITSNLELLAWIEATLALGANIFNVHGEVGLNFRFPKFSSKFTIGYGAGGFCNQDPGSITTGAKIVTKAEISVELASEIALGPGLTQFDKTELWGLHFPLGETCYPIDIPGLTPDNPIPHDVTPKDPIPDNLVPDTQDYIKPGR